MVLSNIQIKDLDNGYCCLKCDISAEFTEEKELCFIVKDEFKDWLTDDVYDAFMVAMLYPAMYYNENIEIKGSVSKKLYYNIKDYVCAIIKDFNKSTNNINISVDSFADAHKNKLLHVGTGFSGGVDSFSTLTDRLWNDDLSNEYKIDTLFFFHVGQYGDIRKSETRQRALNRFQLTEQMAERLGLNAVFMDTNLFRFYLPEWEYKIGVLCRITSVLVFQKALSRYYISNAYTYGEMIDLAHDRVFLEEFADPYIMPLLSPVGLDIVCDGAQYKRTEKTRRIANNKIAQEFLNVCVNSQDWHVNATNCGKCTKCLRTMMALDSIDALDKFTKVFNPEDWKKRGFIYKCHQVIDYNKNGFARDNVDFARLNGKYLPNKFVAYISVMIEKISHAPRKIKSLLK